MESLYVPVAYDDRHELRTAAGESPWVVAHRDPASTPELLRVDLTIADDAGRVALQIDGLVLRPLDRAVVAHHTRPS